MLITERLQQEQFPASQQAVVDYILANPLAIKEMTIRQLAKATFTSNATMIRIARKLNYPGWDQFKEDFIREQEYLALSFSSVDPNIPFTASDTPVSIAMKIAELSMEAISDTLHLLDEKELEKAARILKQNQIINVLAMSNVHILGELFALKLGRLHKLAFASDFRDEARYNGTLIHPQSCAVVISYSGETRQLVEAVENIKKHHRPVIVLTSIGDNSLSRLADVTLRFCTREKLYSKISWYTSESGIEYLLDLLYSTLFWLDYDRNMKLRMDTARIIEQGRPVSAAIIQEEYKPAAGRQEYSPAPFDTRKGEGS